MDHMRAAIVHNIPIHYKHLLFDALRKQGLDFEVLFIASGSSIRHESIALSEDTYRHRIGFEGPYEEAPPIHNARWIWAALQDIRPSVIVVGSYNAAECWSAWLWAFVHRVPIVMWYTGNEFDYPRHWPKELLKRIFLAGCAGAQRRRIRGSGFLATERGRCPGLLQGPAGQVPDRAGIA